MKLRYIFEYLYDKQVNKYKEATKYLDSLWIEENKQEMDAINEYLQKE